MSDIEKTHAEKHAGLLKGIIDMKAENKQLHKDNAELQLQVHQLQNRVANHSRMIIGYQNELMELRK